MLILASTSDIIRAVTGSAANIAANASYVDNASGSITPGRTDTAAITTATTTTVVGSPGSSTQRTVETMTLRNTSNSTATTIVVQHYDGSTSIDLTPTMTLQPGEALALDDHGRWKHVLSAGAQLLADRTPVKRPLHGSWLAETYPREYMAEAGFVIGVNAQCNIVAIYLKAGMVISNISMWSGTAAVSPTHWQFGVYAGHGGLVAASADQGSAAIGANTLFTLAMATPYTVPRSGMYYVAWTVTATTQPGWKQVASITAKGPNNAAYTQIFQVNAGAADANGLLSGTASPVNVTSSGTNMAWAAVS